MALAIFIPTFLLPSGTVTLFTRFLGFVYKIIYKGKQLPFSSTNFMIATIHTSLVLTFAMVEQAFSMAVSTTFLVPYIIDLEASSCHHEKNTVNTGISLIR